MAILEGIRIQNYRSLKDVTLGKTFESQKPEALPRLMAVIGANGVGKSTLLDVFGFIGDCLNDGVEAACDRPHRGGFERLRTLGASGPIQFEIRYRQAKGERPISYSLHIDLDKKGRVTVVYAATNRQEQWPAIFFFRADQWKWLRLVGGGGGWH